MPGVIVMRRATIDHSATRREKAACVGRAIPVRQPASRQALPAAGLAVFALLLLWLGQATAQATESLPLAIVAVAFAFLIAVALWSAVAGGSVRR